MRRELDWLVGWLSVTPAYLGLPLVTPAAMCVFHYHVWYGYQVKPYNRLLPVAACQVGYWKYLTGY
jgi:hypothetical protein